MGDIRSYEDLVAWQKAYRLGLLVYELSQAFPAEERYEMTQQVRRSALSVPCNIAEGWGRRSTADYLRFLKIARGSAYELRTQVRFAGDLGYIPAEHQVYDLALEVERLVNGLIRSVESHG